MHRILNHKIHSVLFFTFFAILAASWEFDRELVIAVADVEISSKVIQSIQSLRQTIARNSLVGHMTIVVGNPKTITKPQFA